GIHIPSVSHWSCLQCDLLMLSSSFDDACLMVRKLSHNKIYFFHFVTVTSLSLDTDYCFLGDFTAYALQLL
ncbi:hypothetical protein Tco_1305422, partial [Tanacetum coccineum]